LIGLLGREHAGRRAAYERFRGLWRQFADEGMRADLARLSITPTGGKASTKGSAR
jgi:hypothetical protein